MRKYLSSKPRPAGFSLIEILIAMLILSIAIIALADLFLWAIRKNGQSSQMSKANQYAQEKLEELFATDFGTLSVNNNTDCAFDWGLGSDVSISVANCWQSGADPCPARGTDVVSTITGYNRQGGVTAPTRQIFDRCWWVLPGPQNTTAQEQSRILRVMVRPRGVDPAKGFVGKPVLADISLIKVGNVGGAFTRN